MPDKVAALIDAGLEAGTFAGGRVSGNPATRAEGEADAAPAQSGRPTEVTAGPLLDRVLAGRVQALGARFWRIGGRVPSARRALHWCSRSTRQWTRIRGWTKALLAFRIHFGDRLPD
jgi:hypothetical protein